MPGDAARSVRATWAHTYRETTDGTRGVRRSRLLRLANTLAICCRVGTSARRRHHRMSASGGGAGKARMPTAREWVAATERRREVWLPSLLAAWRRRPTV